MPEHDDPIAEARRLLADIRADWAESGHLPQLLWVECPIILLETLCDRLAAAQREFRQSHEANCVPDYTERGLHSSWCRLYMVGPE